MASTGDVAHGRRPVAGFWKTIGLVAGTFVLAGVIYCSKGCSPD